VGEPDCIEVNGSKMQPRRHPVTRWNLCVLEVDHHVIGNPAEPATGREELGRFRTVVGPRHIHRVEASAVGSLESR
jgi:hypothetical protein